AGGIAEINFPSRENAGHDSWYNQKPEQRPAGRSEHHGHLEQVFRHRAEGVKNLKSEGRQRRHHHDEQDTEFDAVEPDDGEHHPQKSRNALEKRHPWRDEILGGSRMADDHCKNTAENEGAEQPAENSAGSKQHVDQKGSSRQYLDGARNDLRDRRE